LELPKYFGRVHFLNLNISHTQKTKFRIQAYGNACTIKDKPEDMKQLLKLRVPSKQRLLANKLSCTSNNMLILPLFLSVEN
jgi:hypothetical protein